MLKESRTLIAVKDSNIKKYKRIFEKTSGCDLVEVIDLKVVLEGKYEDRGNYKMMLLCIDNVGSALRYLFGMREKHSTAKIYMIPFNSHFVRAIIRDNKICYERGKLVETIKGLLRAQSEESVLPIDSATIIDFCNGAEVICQCCRGVKERVLYSMWSVWEHFKGHRDCMVAITGDITLQDASDICSVLDKIGVERIDFGCCYEENSIIKVFSLWKVNRKY